MFNNVLYLRSPIFSYNCGNRNAGILTNELKTSNMTKCKKPRHGTSCKANKMATKIYKISSNRMIELKFKEWMWMNKAIKAMPHAGDRTTVLPGIQCGSVSVLPMPFFYLLGRLKSFCTAPCWRWPTYGYNPDMSYNCCITSFNCFLYCVSSVLFVCLSIPCWEY